MPVIYVAKKSTHARTKNHVRFRTDGWKTAWSLIISIGDSIKVAEARLTEIAVLKTHIINYAKTREVYTAYRKTGYSKAFLEAHREENTLHKAAKAAFDEAGLQKLPKVKVLDAEFAEEKDTTEKTQTR